jgi:hypothetical protein
MGTVLHLELRVIITAETGRIEAADLEAVYQSALTRVSTAVAPAGDNEGGLKAGAFPPPA